MREKTEKAIEQARVEGRLGRPTDLTPQVADAIVLAVRTGAPLTVAAQSQGIPKGTFMEWMARGEGRHPERPMTPLYADFADRVRKAEAEVHLLTIATIRTAAVTRGNWEAARAWLRMRWPEDYAERTEVTGADGGPLVMELAALVGRLSDDAIDTLLQQLGASADPGDGAPSEEGTPPIRLVGG